MKRFVLSLIAIMTLVLIGTASAAPFRSMVNAKSATDDTVIFQVSGTNVVYTQSIDGKYIKNDEDVGILYKATRNGAGVINIKLDMQTSFKPATTGAADTDYLNSHSVTSSITDETWHLATFDTVILPYIRFAVTGQGSNDDGTLIEIKVSK